MTVKDNNINSSGSTRRSFLQAGSFLLARAAMPACAKDVEQQTSAALSLSNDRIKLHFSEPSGRWLALKDASTNRPILDNGGSLASVTVTARGQQMGPNGSPLANASGPLVDAYSFGSDLRTVACRKAHSDGADEMLVDAIDGGWHIEQHYVLRGNTLARRVRLTWSGDREILLRWVDLTLPRINPEGIILEAPGRAEVLHQRLDQLPMGYALGAMNLKSYGAEPFLAFRHLDTNLLIWGFDKDIPSAMGVNRDEQGVWLTQRFLASCRVENGQTIEVGTQYLRLHHGDFNDALEGIQHFWEEVDLHPAGKTPCWAKDARIYEVHLGPKPFEHAPPYDPYPGIAELSDDLPRIAGMGFNIVQLMPRFPFPGYAVHDYQDIKTQYAPPAELRRIVGRAHDLGMKVVLDVVLHGVCDQSAGRPIGGMMGPSPYTKHPWLTEHPDWFSYTEDGRVAKTYTWAFDHANPSFQKFFANVLCDYVRVLDVDGFRIDAPLWDMFPNWAKGLRRPGYLSYYGSVPLLELARAQVRNIKADAIFYLETVLPLFRGSGDLFYAHDEHAFFGVLLPVLSQRGYAGSIASGGVKNAWDLAQWLDLQRRAWPRGLIKVHYADSHDSFEWGGLGMSAKEAFGSSGARLLFAYASFLSGGVMNYVGTEKGSDAFYRRVLELRESIPALREGDCDYMAVRPTDDRVFALLHRYQDQWALPVLSFSANNTKAVLPLDVLDLEPSKIYTFREAFSGSTYKTTGRELTHFHVDLPAYGVQLWTAEAPSAENG